MGVEIVGVQWGMTDVSIVVKKKKKKKLAEYIYMMCIKIWLQCRDKSKELLLPFARHKPDASSALSANPRNFFFSP